MKKDYSTLSNGHTVVHIFGVQIGVGKLQLLVPLLDVICQLPQILSKFFN